MIQQQVIDRGIHDDRIIAAMRSVPRENFFPKDSGANVYADRACPIGHGQSISQPYMVALMSSRLNAQPDHKVLEIGTGSGYQSAVLAHLAGQVYSIERIKPLLDSAFERLLDLGLRNIHFRHGDGTLGWSEEAPFDRIIITAGAPDMPRQLLLSQLKDTGLAILPVGPADNQHLLEIRRAGDELHPQEIVPCRFVKLIGHEGWRE